MKAIFWPYLSPQSTSHLGSLVDSMETCLKGTCADLPSVWSLIFKAPTVCHLLMDWRQDTWAFLECRPSRRRLTRCWSRKLRCPKHQGTCRRQTMEMASLKTCMSSWWLGRQAVLSSFNDWEVSALTHAFQGGTCRNCKSRWNYLLLHPKKCCFLALPHCLVFVHQIIVWNLISTVVPNTCHGIHSFFWGSTFVRRIMISTVIGCVFERRL